MKSKQAVLTGTGLVFVKNLLPRFVYTLIMMLFLHFVSGRNTFTIVTDRNHIGYSLLQMDLYV